ncbi:hypothetical protein [Luteimonas salinilitoris]|uniref:Spore coat protein U domain-containing protein n=1 Tax=Luteimonas salinilitoris TaxID=3237697 RepID=A0ABV4HVQ3_9GAMM
MNLERRGFYQSVSLGLILAVIAMSLSLAALPAHAQQVALRTCVLNGSVFFPLELTPTTAGVFAAGNASVCTDQTLGTGISGEFIISGYGSASCLTQSFRGDLTILWNNNNTSEVSFSPALSGVGAYVGRVESGELAGTTVALVLTPPVGAELIQCTLGGVNEYAVTGSLSFIQVY